MRRSLILLFLVGLAAAALLPRLLDLRQVGELVVEGLEQRTGGDVTVAGMRWNWLPLPHLSLADLRIHNRRMDAAIPACDVYPRWLTLLRGRIEIRRLALGDPRLVVKDVEGRQGGAGGFLFPAAELTVKNGNLSLAPGALAPWVRAPRPLILSDIHGRIAAGTKEIAAAITCTPPFSGRMEVEGSLRRPENTFEFRLAATALRIHELLPTALEQSPYRPVRTEVNLKATVQGRGTGAWTARVQGDLPLLLIEPGGTETAFSCGVADFAVEKRFRELTVTVKNVEMTDPALSLSGIFRVTAPERPGAETVWDIDLQGRGIDLTALREKVLAVLGWHKTAARVCGIVLGGTARSAAYSFHGPTSHFRRLRAMTITADVERARIHVPGADLDLDEASGPVRIEDGFLTGKRLSATMGGSSGKNGNLVLELDAKDRAFKLDLDLDADLAELPPILHRLVKDEDFRRELGMFRDVRGRASGRLALGERLKEIRVHLDVHKAEAEAFYERLSLPVAVHRGRLRVAPKEVSWSEVEADAPPHRIASSKGSVQWHRDIQLKIDALEGLLDSRALLAELERHPVLDTALPKVLSCIDGPIELKESSLAGPARRPRQWRYRMAVTARDIAWTSPMLPGPVYIAQANASVDEHMARVTTSGGTVAGKALDVAGELVHHLWQDWHGWLVLNGTAGEAAHSWVRGKGWIPDVFLPRPPCTLRNLRVSWKPGGAEVLGTVLAGEAEPEAPAVRVSLVADPKSLKIRELDVIDQERHGGLTLDLQKAPRRELRLGWRGTVTAETLNRILTENRLLSGSLEGSLDIEHNLALGYPTLVEGTLEATGLCWPWSPAGPLDVRRVKLHGYGGLIDLERLEVALGAESMEANGTAALGDGALRMDFDLHSPSLSSHTLERFLPETWRETARGRKAGAHGGEAPGDRRRVEGLLRFSLDEFHHFRNGGDPGKTGADALTWGPIEGKVEIQPGRLVLSVSRAILCGLRTGWTWQTGSEPSFVLSIRPPGPGEEDRFEEILPCLGWEQSMVEGPFTLAGFLAGPAPGDWRQGTLSLDSEGGRIYRMALLAKIFSLVNVTDLFSGGLPDLVHEGFGYSKLAIEAAVEDNALTLKKAVLLGQGLNLFASGKVSLETMDCDLTILVAPFKTIDTIVTMVPLLGRVIGGEDDTVITIPVGVQGPITDPDITPLPPEAVGEAILNLVTETLKLPYSILQPLLPQGR